jgi:hypothetical protein
VQDVVGMAVESGEWSDGHENVNPQAETLRCVQGDDFGETFATKTRSGCRDDLTEPGH